MRVHAGTSWPSTIWWTSWRRLPTRAWTWSNGAVSSPSAAESSTCSRRPKNTHRLDFWGDTVEDIQWFVADQRSLEPAEHGLWAPPCRELLLTDDAVPRPNAGRAPPELADLFDKIAAGVAVEGMESLAPVLVDEMELLLDLLPAGTHVLVCDPERVHPGTRPGGDQPEFLEASWAAAAGGGRAPIDLGAAAYRTLGEVRGHAIGRGLPWWGLSPYGTDEELVGDENGACRAVPCRPGPPTRIAVTPNARSPT